QSYFLMFSPYHLHRELHSFPTRRSSDLGNQGDAGKGRAAHELGPGQQHDRPAREIGVDRVGFEAGLAGIDDERKIVRVASDQGVDRKSTRLNSSHVKNSYAVFCLKKKKT